MLDFYQKRRLQQFLVSKPFLIFLTVPVVLVSYTAWNAYGTTVETRTKRLELTSELARLEARTTELEQDLTNLDDPRGVEAELRKRYEVGKEGEELVVLVDMDKQDDVSQEQPELPLSWWERVVNWF